MKYSGRSNLEKTTKAEIESLAKEMGTKLFETPIRECVKTKEAQEKKALLIDYAPKCNTLVDYMAFVDELLNK